MPRIAVDSSQRMNLRVHADQKARLVRAAALRSTGLTDFVLQNALREADAVIEQAESLTLTPRDSVRVLALLDDPPAPNARLRAAAIDLPPAE